MPDSSSLIDATNVKMRKTFKLQQEQPMQNTSFLRAEMQEACAGKPIFWADSVDEAELQSM
ncbi:unnamed protein product, partial [Rotaria sp. Silwood1]